MKDGFVRCASATVDIKVADTDYNTSNIIKAIEDAAQNDIKLIVFPELCITGYTCGDLFLQKILIDSAKDSLIKIAKATENLIYPPLSDFRTLRSRHFIIVPQW